MTIPFPELYALGAAILAIECIVDNSNQYVVRRLLRLCVDVCGCSPCLERKLKVVHLRVPDERSLKEPMFSTHRSRTRFAKVEQQVPSSASSLKSVRAKLLEVHDTDGLVLALHLAEALVVLVLEALPHLRDGFCARTFTLIAPRLKSKS